VEKDVLTSVVRAVLAVEMLVCAVIHLQVGSSLECAET